MKHLLLPTEKSAEIALRTQQIIAFETGVANVVDPLGGSWYIEHLTDKIENEAENYFTEIEKLGGVIPAIEDGYFQREISRSSSEYQTKVDKNHRIVVGVNKFKDNSKEIDIPLLEIDDNVGMNQIRQLKLLKKSRNQSNVNSILEKITEECKHDSNLMPFIISAAKEYATLGEIIKAMKNEFGEWQETVGF